MDLLDRRAAIARSLVLTGQLDDAEKRLQGARKSLPPSSQINRVKLDICHVQLLAARGEFDRARAKLWSTVDLADACGLVHHRQKLSDLERQLKEPRARQSSVSPQR